MAQTMLLTSGVSANQFLRNKNPLAQPKVHHLFLSGNSHVVLPSRRPSLVPLAIFKPKTKAAPKKVFRDQFYLQHKKRLYCLDGYVVIF
ncbi:hypothetical protein HA466_0285050 [Hirschfeldia incana]|nr:hypothetical protein HA466_0285050 [Hirschfeldia incana]